MTAVSMGSKIYVLNGCYKEERSSRRSEKRAVVHCFDPLKNVWLKKASTLYPHFNSTLFVDNNKLYVAGGWDTVPNESSGYIQATGGAAPVEVYNEESNSWYVVKQNRIPSNTLGAVERLEGKVFQLTVASEYHQMKCTKYLYESGKIPWKELIAPLSCVTCQ